MINKNYSKGLLDRMAKQRVGDSFNTDEFDKLEDKESAFAYLMKHVKGIAIPSTFTLAVAVFAHPQGMYAETGLLRDYLTSELNFDMSINNATIKSAILNSNVHRIVVDEIRGVLTLIK